MAVAVVVVASLAVASASASGPRCVVGGARAPAVVTDHAVGVTASTATLRGKVDPHGCATSYRFEYGTTMAYGSVTPEVAAGSGNRSVVAEASLAGLSSRTLFHFRVVATSATGTTAGGDLPFKTKFVCAPGGARAPAVVTEPAGGVTATGVSLAGKVNAHGCATSYRFEYGTSTAYGSATPEVAAGSGTRSILAAASLSGLSPRTVFHFRIVAVSAAGMTAGADGVFTTGLAPPSVRVVSHRAVVKRGFVAVIEVSCRGAGGACQGTLVAFRRHRVIGQRSFLLAGDRSGMVSMRLNRRGRNLLRGHRRPRVVVLVRGTPSAPPTSVTLIRKFRPR
jgi:hypothetical protein